ncbi:MAG: hypothetical protein AB7O43_00475 [Hyphomicrobiaceae bacterium]
MKAKGSGFAGCSALCVDNEVLVALDSEWILKSLGFGHVYAAFSFQDASFVIDQQKFDFALLDIDLGGGRTSIGLARRLLKKGTAVVFASGHTYTLPTAEALGLQVLRKPLELSDVKAALAAMAGHCRMEASPAG